MVRAFEPLTVSAHAAHHAAEKTGCVHGHPWTAESAYIRKDGTRQCRICKADRQRQQATKFAERYALASNDRRRERKFRQRQSLVGRGFVARDGRRITVAAVNTDGTVLTDGGSLVRLGALSRWWTPVGILGDLGAD